jgi:hypothetical protein
LFFHVSIAFTYDPSVSPQNMATFSDLQWEFARQKNGGNLMGSDKIALKECRLSSRTSVS